MHFSSEFIKEIKDRTDIYEIINQYTDLHSTGEIYQGRCPLHDDNNPSFRVYPETQSYYCFGCGAGSREENGSSDVIAFLIAKEGWTFAETIEYLANRASMELPKEKESEEVIKVRVLRDQLVINNRTYYLELQENPKALQVLKDRGVMSKDIDKYRIGYVRAHTKVDLRNRIVICLFDDRGLPVGFAYRALDDKAEHKYINDSNNAIFTKSNILYGLNFIRHSIKDSGYVVIVEGYFDVISLQKLDIPAVGIMNTSISEAQINLIKKYTSTVLLFLDNDLPGQKATLKNITKLREAGLIVKVVEAYRHKDPDDMAQEMGSYLLEYINDKAMLAGQYLISKELSAYTTEVVEAQHATVKKLKTILSCIPEGIEKFMYEKEISRALNIPYSEMNKLLRS